MLKRLITLVAVNVFATACATSIDRIAVQAARLDVRGGAKEAVERAWAGADSEAFPIDAHRIVVGDHIVLSKRSFERGDFPSLDTAGFEFVSLAIPRIDERRTFDVASESISVLYSLGSSTFPDLACYSYATSGEVTVEPDRYGGFRVTFSVKLAFGPSPGLNEDCWGLDVADEGAYRLEDISKLSPWLGGAYPDPSEAAYR